MSVVVLIRPAAGYTTRPISPPPASAEQVLATGFVREENTDTEYRERLQILHGGPRVRQQ
ncbi:hypothetical protein [Mycobacterium sp. ITM-2016-00318]|uniref:hypothetical protein n=1 Tax=Mycobacterium sp. ITM-2016-00318 TaxID=2099693 RepID=UPI00115C3174|nr:hypothetical protein [Mycobacterium sp. ITM-2016-00318]WNG92221.1 hypothetical protein C6A82_022850 [Mycobacterium sp. ITM-2016-00318]